MKFGLSSIAILTSLFTASAINAQTTLPYSSGFDSPGEKAGWQEIRMGAEGLYRWNISPALPYSPTESLGHGYPVGGTTVTDDWFISPSFSLPEGGNIDSLRFMFSGFGVPGDADTIGVYLLAGSPNPELASEITLLHDFRDEGYTSDGQWRQIENIDIPSTEGLSYIAFRYKTVSNWLDVKFDNIGISSAGVTSIDPTEIKKTASISIYPNPTTGKINIQSTTAIREITVLGINGQILRRQPFSQTIDLSKLDSGVYIINFIDTKEQHISHRLIKM